MRYLLMLAMNILFSASLLASDLHFVYVRLDNSMDAEALKERITALKNDLADSDFVLYYSNGSVSMDKKSWNETKLFGLINTQNSSVSISIPDEIENISSLLEKMLAAKSYSDIYFNCFVGSGFFENDFQNTLLARMLLVNSLIDSEYKVALRYFPCGASYPAQKTAFNTEYNINLSPQIISSL